jgi:acyl carrier protein
MPSPSDDQAGPAHAVSPPSETGPLDPPSGSTSELVDPPEAPYEAPRTEAEELVASVFAQVLELERVGVHDDLFRHGGNSLHAAQVIGRINDATGLDASIDLVFEYPTVSELTQALEKLAEAPS